MRIKGAGSLAIMMGVAAGCGAFVGTSSGADDGTARTDGGSGDAFAEDASGSSSNDGGNGVSDGTTSPSEAGDASGVDGEAGIAPGSGFCSLRSSAVFCADFDETPTLMNAGFPATTLVDALAVASSDTQHHASGTRSAEFTFPMDTTAERTLLLRTSALALGTSAFTVHWKLRLNALPTMGEVWTILEAATDTGGNYAVAIDGTGMKCGLTSQPVSVGVWQELVIGIGAGKLTCTVIGGGSSNSTDMQAETFAHVTLSVEGVGKAPEDFIYNVDDVVLTSP